MGGCVRRVGVLVLLVALFAGAWLFRDRLRLAWREFRGIEEEEEVLPSPELADAAAGKLESLRSGERSSIALSGVELQSLLIYRYAGVFPAFLDSPTVILDGDVVRLRARMPVDNLPHVDALDDVIGLLPDTTELALDGKLLPLESGRVALAIDGVSASRVPLPRRLIVQALDRIGRRDEPGLPPDAIAVSLPPGVVAVYVRRDSLFLLTRRAAPPQ